MKHSLKTWIVVASFCAVGASTGTQAQTDKAFQQRVEAAEKRFAEVRPKIRPTWADAIASNFSQLGKVIRKEKLFAFDEGLIQATSAAHQDKPGCKGLAPGLLCEIHSQIDKAVAELKPQAKVECAKAADPKACATREQADAERKLQEALQKLNAIGKSAPIR